MRLSDDRGQKSAAAIAIGEAARKRRKDAKQMAEPERHAEVRRKTGNKGPNTKFQTSDKKGTEKIKISFFNDKAAGRGKGKGQGKGKGKGGKSWGKGKGW